jgi:hypothetical protein
MITFFAELPDVIGEWLRRRARRLLFIELCALRADLAIARTDARDALEVLDQLRASGVPIPDAGRLREIRTRLDIGSMTTEGPTT